MTASCGSPERWSLTRALRHARVGRRELRQLTPGSGPHAVPEPRPRSARNFWTAAIGLAIPLLVLVLAVAEGRAADTARLTSLSSAAEIRAARAAAPGPELQLSYLLLDEKLGESLRTFSIGDGYAYVIATAATTLFDFRLRRVIVIDRVARTFTSQSLHAVVADRSFELEDRVEEYKLRRERDPRAILAEEDEPFWIETETGMQSADLPRPEIGRTPLTSNAIQYRYKGQPVARFTPAAEVEVSDDELATFGTLLRHVMAVHPEIFAAMQAFRKVPSVISYNWLEDNRNYETQYRLRGVRRTTADYPLPADWPVASPPILNLPAFVADLLPVLSEALAGRYAGGPRAPDAYRRAIADEMAAGPDLRTVLTYIEFITNHGPRVVSCPQPPDPANPCFTMREVIDRAMPRDARVRPYVTGIFGQAREPERVVQTWEQMRKDGLPNAYILDMAAAVALSGGGEAEGARAERLFASVLRGNPYLPGVYKDIADHLMRRYDTATAWLFYDAGRALPNSGAAGLLAPIDAMERGFESEFPEYYLAR